MKNFNGIPVFEASIEEDTSGMVRISLVDSPAVFSNFQKFSTQCPQKFSVVDEEKRLVRGVVMRADFPIYRNGDEGEFFLVYKPQTIRKMAEKYLAEGRQNNINLNHEDGSDVEGVQMVQYFIKDTNAGINPQGFEDIAEGSLFAEFHVVNGDVWQEIKNGTYKGFSLEGVFDIRPMRSEEKLNKSKNKMGIFAKMKESFSKFVTKFGEVATDKGLLITEGNVEEGAEVILDGETPVSAPNGEYTTEDGKVIVVEDGVIKEIREPAQMGAVATDKGEIHFEGDDLKAGDEVYLLNEDGEKIIPEDGDYKTKDGKVIRISDGKVSEIVDDDAQGADEGFAAVRQNFERSYNEAFRKIAEAMSNLYSEFYVEEAGDGYAVVCVYDAVSGAKYYRHVIAWTEAGQAEIVGEGIEVKPAFIPLDADAAEIFSFGALKKRVADLEAENKKIKEQATALGIEKRKPVETGTLKERYAAVRRSFR